MAWQFVQKHCQLGQGAMVPTWQKAMASLSFAPTMTEAAAQMELWWEHAAAPALMPAPGGSSEHTWGRCAWVEELLCLVPELWKEGSRLRSIRECERE